MEKPLSIEPEVICGHLVSTETKKLWNVLLDLFDQVDRICKKHQIQYFAGAGTLLGAVRHKGFIPWDDDMDLFMLADEYLKFCEIAPQELSDPYYLQTYKASDVYWPDLALIRRSDTTGCTRRALEGYIPPANLGIFVDIFPLTNIPAGKISYEIHSIAVKAYRKAIRGHERYLHAKYKGKLTWRNYLDSTFWAWKGLGLFSKDYEGLCDQFINLLTSVKDSGLVGLKSYISHDKRFVFPKEWFEDIIELPFENRKMPCPKMFDEYLRQAYGEYWKFVKGASSHDMVICDPDTPYSIKLAEYQDKL